MHSSGSVEKLGTPPFDEVPLVVLPPVPAVELSVIIPVQPEFALPPFFHWRVYVHSSYRSRDVEVRVQLSKMHAVKNVMKLLVCRVTHTAACLERFERAMDDVGDQRLAVAEERITEFIAEQIADCHSPRTQLSALERATRSKLRSIGIPSVPSESNGNHSHSSSSSSSECAPPSDSEARPNFDAVMDGRDHMFDNLCFDLTHEQMIEANEACELL